MKRVIFLTTLIVFGSLDLLYGQRKKLSCDVIKVILDQRNIRKVLGTDSTEIKNPIRIIDLTGKLEKCTDYFEGFSYFTVESISPNVNTGLFRDIVITEIKCKGKIVFADIYCAHYFGYSNRNTNYHLTMTLEIMPNGSLELKSETIAEWHKSQNVIDYEKE